MIADLVVNHTSDQHPWFKAARRSKDNPYRDYYVWRSDPPPDTSDKVVFPDQEDSIWELDERTGEWYLHHFYSHQPDLNFANPEVRDEIAKSIGFWLQLGLAGFRVDAVPFLIADVDTAGDDVPGDPHDYLKALRSFLGRRRGDAILLGEVNLPHPEQRAYFGGSARRRAHHDVRLHRHAGDVPRAGARGRPPAGEGAQGAARIHRGLPVGDVRAQPRRADPRQALRRASARRSSPPSARTPDMQIYGRGLKRRLPTMLDGDPRRIRMVYSLLFSLPGTPTLYYGEEIGMGEDLEAEGRMAVRTPMQWEPSRNGGFSTAAPRRLIQRLVPDGYGPEHVNVADQKRDPDSLWTFMRALIQTYRECPELGWGDFADPAAAASAGPGPLLLLERGRPSSRCTTCPLNQSRRGSTRRPTNLPATSPSGSRTCSPTRRWRRTRREPSSCRWTATATAGCAYVVEIVPVSDSPVGPQDGLE